MNNVFSDKKRVSLCIFDQHPLISLLCFIFFLTGCATSDDVGRMQWQVNELKSEVKRIKRTEPEKKGLKEEQQATSEAVSDLLLEVQTLRTDVQVLTGRFEESLHFSEKNIEELTESDEQITSKINDLEIAVTNLKKRLDEFEVQGSSVQQKTGTIPEDPEKKAKDAYMEAYQAYKANDLEKAKEKFQTLLKTYPTNEFSDNARFWIGEIYFKEKNYENAILAYDELLKKHPKSDKAPGALLKQGLAFYELKKNTVAKTILQELIKKYPNSKQAQIAKRKLAK
jgi:tol-pal system protein YbgF